MTRDDPNEDGVELSGLDGANPLSFLTSLGTLVTLHGAGEEGARLRWRRRSLWVPVVDGVSTPTRAGLSAVVARGLRGNDVSEDAERKRTQAERRYEASRKAVEDRKKSFGKKGRKGGDGEADIESEVRPLEEVRDQNRDDWLRALSDAVPRPELALGKKIDCTRGEYREHARVFQGRGDREALDFLAAFGSDACLERKSDLIEPTFFCFIKGGGHQFFLDTVRQLIQTVSTERVEKALFEPWAYKDETLSMRWDPAEDRRYALMDRDPTSSDNKARTVWMANLLAYRGLVLFPSAPTRRGLGVSGWAVLDREASLIWPIWEFPAGADTIRSLVQLLILTAPNPDRFAMRARGISAAFRARRIRFPPTGSNYKWNFAPARALL